MELHDENHTDILLEPTPNEPEQTSHLSSKTYSRNRAQRSADELESFHMFVARNNLPLMLGLWGIGITLVILTMTFPAALNHQEASCNEYMTPQRKCSMCSRLTGEYWGGVVTPCMNVMDSTSIFFCVVWTALAMMILQGRFSRNKRDTFRRPRQLILQYLILSLVTWLVFLLNRDGDDAYNMKNIHAYLSSRCIWSIISALLWFVLVWCMLFISCPFPSAQTENFSRQCAQVSASVVFLVNLLSYNVSYLAQGVSLCILGLVQVTCILMLIYNPEDKKSSMTHRPERRKAPTIRAVLHAVKTILVNPLRRYQESRVAKRIHDHAMSPERWSRLVSVDPPQNRQIERYSYFSGDETTTPPGFLCTFAAAIWSISTITTGVELALLAGGDYDDFGHPHGRHWCLDDNCCATLTELLGITSEMWNIYQGFYCFNYCLRGFVILPLLPPMLYIDFVLHEQYWSDSTQNTIITCLKHVSGNVSQYSYRPEDWEELGLIAAGAEGEVHRAALTIPPKCPWFQSDMEDSCSLNCHLDVCLKIPHLPGIAALEATLHEAAVLIQIQERLGMHSGGLEHIVPFVGFCCEVSTVAMLLKYCNSGDLLHKLQKEASNMRPEWFGFQQAVTSLHSRLALAHQVARALSALHWVGVAHLDVKTDNVLMHDEHGSETVYLGDFGTAYLVSKDCLDVMGCIKMEAMCSTHLIPANTGTQAFMAPELQYGLHCPNSSAKLRINPFAADAFSYGFVLYECITLQREPRCRQEASTNADLQAAPRLQPGELDGAWGSTPACVVSILEQCFEQNPSARPSLIEVVAAVQMGLNEVASNGQKEHLDPWCFSRSTVGQKSEFCES